MRSYRNGLIFILTGIYLLVISALLALAFDQVLLLTQLYRVSVSALPVTDFDNLSRPGLGGSLLIVAIIAMILFWAVRNRPRRLWPVSIIALFIFITLNLYSGRHLLPQLLIWPTPVSLAEQYTQAVTGQDLEATLFLAGQSNDCQTIMEQTFHKHQAQIQQRFGANWPEKGFQTVVVKKITTFYEKPVSQRLVFMQPVPQQLVTIMAKIENTNTSNIWLNLKMSYSPIWGSRYICGQDFN